jgi:3-hydroxyacyl-CoA dehydrogenase
MKLKDYLYLNSISGRGKKVEVSANKVSQMSRPGNPHPYMRVREFSKDEAIEKKIKSEIEKNVRSIKERISILEDMNGFNGDKLMLHKLNCILQEKMGKACDEMQSLLLQYEEKLI